MTKFSSVLLFVLFLSFATATAVAQEDKNIKSGDFYTVVAPDGHQVALAVMENSGEQFLGLAFRDQTGRRTKGFQLRSISSGKVTYHDFNQLGNIAVKLLAGMSGDFAVVSNDRGVAYPIGTISRADEYAVKFRKDAGTVVMGLPRVQTLKDAELTDYVHVLRSNTRGLSPKQF